MSVSDSAAKAELTQAEVYAPRSLQLWRTLLNWLAFFFQIFLQILRGTPSVTQVLSYVGLRHHSLLPSSPSFKPLPVVELPELEPPPDSVQINATDGTDSAAAAVDRPAEKFTVSGGFAPLFFLYVWFDGFLMSHLMTMDTKRENSDAHAQSNQRENIDKDGALKNEKFSGGTCDNISSDGKCLVVLDLDETLVCAYETSSLPASIRNQAIESGLKWFELECVSSDKECEGKPKVNYVTVFERPGLREFLKQLSEFSELVLFTAGLEGYARPLVDRIDVENLFSLRLYRPSTISTEYREHVKDLSCLSKDLCRIVIVDNNPFSFLLQPLNGVPCIPFSAGQPNDGQLLEVLLPLLKHLSQQNDVRPVLYDRFRMPEWFQKHGIPASGWTV
ncbi:CTD small phosphatase-like protein 2 [Vitis vinifera]|uniref:CTD small phosphatase-like protein 2 n=1 Tax=Vitis vinifera TaxID=29760 RepID=A0A438E3F9_VITVI|nr:CTD small phosphatase-like protein 2 [Vitis vinifera]